MSKRLISRLSIILFSSLMVIQSCQTPTNTVSNILESKKFSIKANNCDIELPFIQDVTIENNWLYITTPKSSSLGSFGKYGKMTISKDEGGFVYISISSFTLDGPNGVYFEMVSKSSATDIKEGDVIDLTGSGYFGYYYDRCPFGETLKGQLTTENGKFKFVFGGKSGTCDAYYDFIKDGTVEIRDATIVTSQVYTCIVPTPTPEPTTTPSDEPCDCTPVNSFGIKAYPHCDKKPCSDPLLYPNNDDPYKNCPSFAKDQKGNKSPSFPTESIIIGVYDFDSGEGKPNLTVVLRPNGNNNHYGGFGKNDGSPDSVTKNNIDNTIVYVKGDDKKTNLLISDKNNPPKDPKENWDFNHDAKTGTIEIDTSNKLKKSSRSSFEEILNRPEYNKQGTIENKIITDLSKNITSILKDDKGNKFRENNNVFSHVKPDGIVWNSVSNSVVVDMPSNTLSLPVLGIKLDDVLKTMKIGDTKTIVLENQGNFIEINLKYRGNNKDNPNESVWEVFCGRGN